VVVPVAGDFMAPSSDFPDESPVFLADPPQTEEGGFDAMVSNCCIEDVENPVRVALDPRLMQLPVFFRYHRLEGGDHVVVFEVDGKNINNPWFHFTLKLIFHVLHIHFTNVIIFHRFVTFLPSGFLIFVIVQWE